MGGLRTANKIFLSLLNDFEDVARRELTVLSKDHESNKAIRKNSDICPDCRIGETYVQKEIKMN